MLGDHGVWKNDPALGSIWFPTVDTFWTPYSAGRWVAVPSAGTTWVGREPWSWPTHHYGRWGRRKGSWCWIPASRYGPAWVTWAVAPGVVGWCALGIDDRPVVRPPSGTDRFAARGAYEPHYEPDYEPRYGWTFTSREAFTGSARRIGGRVGRAVPLDGRAGVFITQRTVPRAGARSRHPDGGTSTRVVSIVGVRPPRAAATRTAPPRAAATHTAARVPARPPMPSRGRVQARPPASAVPTAGLSLPLLGRGAPMLSPRSLGGWGSRRPSDGMRPPPGQVARGRSLYPGRWTPRGTWAESAQTPRAQPTMSAERASPSTPRRTSGGLVLGRGPTRSGAGVAGTLGNDLFRSTRTGVAAGSFGRHKD